MWLKKIADHNWWNLDDPLLTLYHCTSEFALPNIQREGVKPLDEDKIIEQVVMNAGLNLKDVPSKVFSQVIRREQPWVYWSTYMNMAKRYCAYVGGGGEFAVDVYRWLKIWADENKLPINPMKTGKTFIIKADIPREMIYVYQGNVIEYFKQVYQTLVKHNLNVNDSMDSREFLTKEVPAQYITDIIPTVGEVEKFW